MFNKSLIVSVAMVAGSVAFAEDTTITGTVSSKCSVYTTTQGVYGNPNPNELSAAAADGGVEPIVRFDVAQANYYIGRITYPNQFSSSPTLADTVTWTGDVNVDQVTDANMSGYDAAKTTYNNVHEYDLTVAGSTWFIISSNALYGYNTAFPAGDYTAIVEAECIAK
jgi:hypothetical protein